MKPGRFLAVFMLAPVLLLPDAAGAIEFSHGITAGAFPFRITAGPDGNFWFTEHLGNRIAKITAAGVRRRA